MRARAWQRSPFFVMKVLFQSSKVHIITSFRFFHEVNNMCYQGKHKYMGSQRAQCPHLSFSRGSVEFEMLPKRTFTISPDNTTQNDDHIIIRQDKHRYQQPR
jgi:hypothetical protein